MAKVFKTYGDKLTDPRWQRKRLEVMNRDNFSCCLCGDKESTLNIHHLKYSGEPWECPDQFLRTLCATCHLIVTQQEVDVSDQNIFVRRVDRQAYTVYILYTEQGLIIYRRGQDGLVMHDASISHECLRFVVHDIVNYWLRSDRDHYLIEKLNNG